MTNAKTLIVTPEGRKWFILANRKALAKHFRQFQHDPGCWLWRDAAKRVEIWLEGYGVRLPAWCIVSVLCLDRDGMERPWMACGNSLCVSPHCMRFGPQRCHVEGCTNGDASRWKGYCRMHYARLKRSGNPGAVEPRAKGGYHKLDDRRLGRLSISLPSGGAIVINNNGELQIPSDCNEMECRRILRAWRNCIKAAISSIDSLVF